MAQYVSYNTKQQLMAALERKDNVYCRASKESEESGLLLELLKKQNTVVVTNRQKSFYAHCTMGANNKVKVQ